MTSDKIYSPTDVACPTPTFRKLHTQFAFASISLEVVIDIRLSVDLKLSNHDTTPWDYDATFDPIFGKNLPVRPM
jgi:hypothetical protein